MSNIYILCILNTFDRVYSLDFRFMIDTQNREKKVLEISTNALT